MKVSSRKVETVPVLFKILMDITHGPGKVCNCPHHKMVPMLVVLFGLDFFLQALGIITVGLLNLTWPLLVIFGGLTKLTAGSCKCYEHH